MNTLIAAENLHPILSRKGNPSMDNLATIFGAVCQSLKVAIPAQAVETH